MADLRQVIADMRKSLSPAEVAEGSKKASENLVRWLREKATDVTIVGLYRPSDPNKDGEVDPSVVITTLLNSKIHFAFPRVVDRFQAEMDFAIPIQTSDWIVGTYGNREPRFELPAVEPNEFGVIIVPGVVFGLAGERVGRGAGFYDRYLERATGAVRVGFAFDFQLMNLPVPQSEWDARMDVVVTDQRVVEIARSPLL